MSLTTLHPQSECETRLPQGQEGRCKQVCPLFFYSFIVFNLPFRSTTSITQNASGRLCLPTTTLPLESRVMERIRAHHHHHLPRSTCELEALPAHNHPPTRNTSDGEDSHPSPPPPSLDLRVGGFACPQPPSHSNRE